MKRIFILFLLLGFIASCTMMRKASRIKARDIAMPERVFDPTAIQVSDGYEVELVAKGFTFPTDAAFDDEGNLYVVEAGYSYEPEYEEPRLLRVNLDGSFTEVYESERTGPINSVDFHEGYFYLTEGGREDGCRVVKVSKDGQNVQVLVEGLPRYGDHHTNGATVGPDGWVYFAQGPATNSAVVGLDNWKLGWLTDNEELHDIPCEDVVLTGHNYVTTDPFSVSPGDSVVTGPYKPFGRKAEKGEVVVGQVPCTGAIMRVRPDGGPVELVAWGVRNTFGLAFSPDGQLYATENGYDARGSRPVVSSLDHLWRIEQGTWYGWPDYSGGVRLDDQEFVRKGELPTKMALLEHPNIPPRPVASFGVHSSSDGLAFSPANGDFGYAGQAFVAQFGDITPISGKTISPVGFQVVRVDTQTGEVQKFAANKKPGPATAHPNSGGFQRPVNVVFSPDGTELYVVDFGILAPNPVGFSPEEESGCIWKIKKK